MVKSLLDILREVTLDPEQRSAFDADPGQYLADQGYEGVADEDLREAFSLVADTLPAEQAQVIHDTHLAGEAGSVGEGWEPHFGAGEADDVYGYTGDDFDEAVGLDSEPADADHGLVHDLGFGEGSVDHDDAGDDVDEPASTMYTPDSADDLDLDGYDDLDDGTDLGTGTDHDPFDLNPFDEDDAVDDLDDDQLGMHAPDQGDHHDGDTDIDLGFF